MKKNLCMALLAAALGAHAQQPQTPSADAQQAQKMAAVKKLYAAYAKSKEPALDESLFTPDFRAALAHERKAAKKAGGAACLDYDFIIQGQDVDSAEVARTLALELAAEGRVKASFRNFDEPVTLHYVFACTPAGGCLIDDIIEPEGSFKQGLRRCLQEQFPKVQP